MCITTNCEILKEMGKTDHHTCLLRNLYAGQKATDREQQTGSKLGKEYVNAVYCNPALFKLYIEYIMRNAGLEKGQGEIKTIGRNINNLRYADNTTLMVESEEKLRSLLRKVKKLA